MAREEHDREDLLREATALVERVELKVEGFAEPITAGYRKDGALSLFFGQDPVWHFNARGELRRGYCAGKLYKAEVRLIEITRVRGPTAVELRSRPLSGAEQSYMLCQASNQLAKLAESLASDRFEIVGQIPADADVVARLQTSLTALRDGFSVAQSPRV